MKHIVVGVTGGIACYKSVEIVNQLKKNGHDVHVIMTQSAQEFVTPLTFQTMSGNQVVTDMFDRVAKWDTKHIELAKLADVFVVVPATANMIGKICHGIADDMLSTTIMAASCPKLIFPAMNTAMYNNPIVKDNLSRLEQFGYHVYGTAKGVLACGDLGEGKLLPWQEVVQHIEDVLKTV